MQELNQMRQKVMLYSLIAFASLVIGFLLFIMNPALGIVFFVGGMIILIFASATTGSRFHKKYKEMICRTVIEKMFDVDVYDPEKGFSEEFVKHTYLVPSGNRFASDDYILGRYKNYCFERSDVCIQDEHTDSKGHKTTTTLFEGNWTVLKFPKKISSYLVIRERGFFSGGRPGGFFSGAPQTEKVHFEDIDFNKRFEVYAEDEHDAFYVLTPHFMESIKELELMDDGRMIIGFMDQEIHILFNNQTNALEPSIWKEVTEDDFKMVENEMCKVIRIMDILNVVSEDE